MCCLRCQQGSFCGWLVVTAMSTAVGCMLLNRPCEHGRLTAIVACRVDVPAVRLTPTVLSPLTALHLGPHFRSLLNSLLISIYQYVSWSFQISDTHVAAQLTRTFRSEVKVRLWLGLLRLTYEGCTETFTTDLDICQFPPHKAENSYTEFHEIWHCWGWGVGGGC
jgi:hypothetical protein